MRLLCNFSISRIIILQLTWMEIDDYNYYNTVRGRRDPNGLCAIAELPRRQISSQLLLHVWHARRLRAKPWR